MKKAGIKSLNDRRKPSCTPPGLPLNIDDTASTTGVRFDFMRTATLSFAHDVNNVLNVVRHSISFLGEDPSSVRFDETLTLVDRCLQQTENMSKELSYLVREGSRRALKSPVDLGRLVNEVLDFVQLSLPSNINVTRYLVPALPSVHCDPLSIFQMILNLCLNARDAMPHGGELSVRLEVIGDSGTMETECMDQVLPSYMRICISDTGVGMTRDVQERIFEPFFTTKAGKGNGLGLSMMKLLLDEHQGHVCVKSEPGRGSTFSIFLPLFHHQEI